jgi:hypothetical protein
MCLGSVITDLLINLQILQFTDKQAPQEQANEQSRDRSKDRPERDITKYVKK